MTPSVVERAQMFAAAAHAGQVRKYTGAPYLSHCIEVSRWVRAAGGDAHQVAAALLHDSVEDTATTPADILREFGDDIAELVRCVTDVSSPSDGTRAFRKRIDREHLAKASPRAQTIKLADVLSNARSVVMYDTSFARVYLPEKRLLLPLLAGGSAMLFDVVSAALDYAEKQLLLDLLGAFGAGGPTIKLDVERIERDVATWPRGVDVFASAPRRNISGPHQMNAADGPLCRCGKPSVLAFGDCADCAGLATKEQEETTRKPVIHEEWGGRSLCGEWRASDTWTDSGLEIVTCEACRRKRAEKNAADG